MAPARYYDAEKNSDGGMFPGVPLRDLEDDEFNAYPEWLKASIDQSPIYRKTPVRHEKPADKKEGE